MVTARDTILTLLCVLCVCDVTRVAQGRAHKLPAEMFKSFWLLNLSEILSCANKLISLNVPVPPSHGIEEPDGNWIDCEARAQMSLLTGLLLIWPSLIQVWIEHRLWCPIVCGLANGSDGGLLLLGLCNVLNKNATFPQHLWHLADDNLMRNPFTGNNYVVLSKHPTSTNLSHKLHPCWFMMIIGSYHHQQPQQHQHHHPA